LTHAAAEPDALLHPLAEFYRLWEMTPPLAVDVKPEALPAIARQLLVHQDDMTPTLEAFHRCRLTLEVQGRQQRGHDLLRHVVLVNQATRRPIEVGAIVIHTARFPAEHRDEILACRTPLGTLLNRERIPHRCDVAGYFRLRPDEHLRRLLNAPRDATLYGRRNTLRGPHDQPLASVLEILPDLDTPGISPGGLGV
jgi:chorismate-pyruvate lyase